VRIRLIGHSCLRADTSAGTILVDPWLWGSCYWRSWWHYPPTHLDDDITAPQFIYLTHHHFDHFHYPSMRKLSPQARVLIPRFGVDVMAGEVRSLGFDRVEELPHGEVVDLGAGVQVASFQYGIDDSCFVIRDGDVTIVDVNDCKIRGRTLEDVARTFGRPTFALKAHSFAQSYPVGYTADDPADLELVRRETYLEDFLRVMRVLRPAYAVPFGSMVAFLHPESIHVNDHLITPGEVADFVARHGGWDGGEVVPMLPGDTWDEGEGFTLSEGDWYTNRSANLERLAAQVRPTIDEASAAEANRHLTWEAFEAYMTRFAAAIPPLVRKLLVPRTICFEVPSDPHRPYWCLHLPGRRVWRASLPPRDRADIIRVPEAILADAIRDDILGVVHGGMRIRTHLAAGGAPSDLAFWGLVAVAELGYLPSPWTLALRPGGPILNRRMLEVGWRRRHEVADMVRAVAGSAMGRGSALERISTGFGTAGPGDGAVSASAEAAADPTAVGSSA
jgi:UDP-MurNAc hydroxylase